MPPALVAAYAALASAFPSVVPGLVGAAPFIGAAAVGLGVVASHTPDTELSHAVVGIPQIAAECIQRNAAAQSTRLAAVVQPLHGDEIYSVILKRGGITGDPVMTVLIQEAVKGSKAEFRPLVPDQTDLVAKIIAGC